MPLESSAGLLPKAVIAALVGSVAGGSAGVWSLGRQAARNAAAPAAVPIVTQSATTTTTENRAASPPSMSPPTQAAPRPQPIQTRPNALPPSANDEANVLQRAQTLARRPDVTALLALRDDVMRRAKDRGIADSLPVKSELDEIDQRLNEARALQLKIDAEEFRKTPSEPREP